MWWVSGGGLVWGVKGTPLPPTLTTFAAGSPSAATGAGGALGIPGTTVLSPDHLGFGAFGGGQFTIGRWLQADQRVGIEAGGFFLGSGSGSFAQNSDGTLPLRVPFTNVPPARRFPVGRVVLRPGRSGLRLRRPNHRRVAAALGRSKVAPFTVPMAVRASACRCLAAFAISTCANICRS